MKQNLVYDFDYVWEVYRCAGIASLSKKLFINWFLRKFHYCLF